MTPPGAAFCIHVGEVADLECPDERPYGVLSLSIIPWGDRTTTPRPLTVILCSECYVGALGAVPALREGGRLAF